MYNIKSGSPKVTYDLWVIMCQFRVKLGKKKYTILVSDIDSKGSCAYVGAGGIREIPEPPGKYCCLHKTAFPKM